MRIWWLLVVVLATVATPARAEPAACAPSLQPGTWTATADDVPPEVPRVYSVMFSHDTLAMNADFSDDTTLVRVSYSTPDGVVELWTTPQRQVLCVPAPAPPVDVPVSIVAYDASGNAILVLTLGEVTRRPRHHCGMGGVGLLLLGVPVLGLLAGIVLLLRAAARHRKRCAPGTRMTPLAAEAMTRMTLDNTVVTIAASLALCFALYITDDAFFATVTLYVPITRALRLISLHRFASLLESGAPAALHGNLLASGDRYIVVSRSVVRAAERQSVPTAVRI